MQRGRSIIDFVIEFMLRICYYVTFIRAKFMIKLYTSKLSAEGLLKNVINVYILVQLFRFGLDDSIWMQLTETETI